MSTYNEGTEMVKDSIESILNQTYQHLEFIIIIDNPKNELLTQMIYDYQEKDNRIKVIRNKENRGLVESLNIAISHCNGKYIARMDADDISEPNRLSMEKEFLEKNNLDFVFSGMIVIDEDGNKLFEMNLEELNSVEVKKRMEHGNISTHPTWFLKSAVYKMLNGYRNIPYCEDFDFSLRALDYGYKIGKIKANLLKYRIRTNSISKSNEFEQMLLSRKLLNLYKRKMLNDFSNVSKEIEIVRNDQLNSKEKEKYYKAASKFEQARTLIKSGYYFKGAKNLIQSFFVSKFHTQKIFKTYVYK